MPIQLKTYIRSLALLFLAINSCHHPTSSNLIKSWTAYDESAQLAKNGSHQNSRMQYKLIQSKFLDKQAVLDDINKQLGNFSNEDYQRLKDKVYEQSILEIRNHIYTDQLTYEELTKWYLFRIRKYEFDSTSTLNAIISINPNAVVQARFADKNRSKTTHPIYGIPVILKDNINSEDVPTTAGALILKNNQTKNAFIVDKMRENGAIILAKANLSEWAYFFCAGCPVGYSAMGGQSLNPYGRHEIETGGSSSGSAIAVAANYATVAIGTETSGSILSPSGKNGVVGLKPTVGLLSRSGIIPISEILDTPGPITKSTIDNAIVLSAMEGVDETDAATLQRPSNTNYWKQIPNCGGLAGLRIGVNKAYTKDTCYLRAIQWLKNFGVEVIEFKTPKLRFMNFRTLLVADMKRSIPKYFKNYGHPDLKDLTVSKILDFNNDGKNRAPYGQVHFEAISKDETSDLELRNIADSLEFNCKNYYQGIMDKNNLDAILSKDNWDAAFAAAAKFPALGTPIGFESDGSPTNATFIARPYQEQLLIRIGWAFEEAVRARKPPALYNF